MSFTKGNDRSDYAVVYDRLRKRSYRTDQKIDQLWGDPTYYLDDAEQAEADMIVKQYNGYALHAAYVRGVKDALDAMELLEDANEAASEAA